MRPIPKATAVAVAALALLFASCSKESAPSLGEPGDAADAERTIEISAEEFEFSVDEIDVEVGETIEFVLTNEGNAQHEFSIGGSHMDGGDHMHGASTGSTGATEPGSEGSFVWTFTEAGETVFACYIAGHNEQGMTGTLTVSG
jgi:uncharacterized cupredoxin-like copper-binding protein